MATKKVKPTKRTPQAVSKRGAETTKKMKMTAKSEEDAKKLVKKASKFIANKKEMKKTSKETIKKDEKKSPRKTINRGKETVKQTKETAKSTGDHAVLNISNEKPIKIDKKTRYSDAELAEFKQVIITKLEKARRDYELLQSTISHGGNNDIEDTSPTYQLLEEGSSILSKEESGRLVERQKKFIGNLEAALVRIENKTYGVCRVTGKLIPKERLMAVPHATLSIEAKNKRV